MQEAFLLDPVQAEMPVVHDSSPVMRKWFSFELRPVQRNANVTVRSKVRVLRRGCRGSLCSWRMFMCRCVRSTCWDPGT